MVRPEPHQPFGKTDVGIECGVKAGLGLLEKVLPLAVGGTLRCKRSIGGLGGIRLAGKLAAHAFPLALRRQALVLLLGALGEDRLRPSL